MNKIHWLLAALFLFLPVMRTNAATSSNLHSNLEKDMKAALVCRKGMERILLYMKKGTFRSKELLNYDQREDLKATWKSFLDYTGALDRLGNQNAGFISLNSDNSNKELFKADYFIFLTQYRFALEFLGELDKIPGAAKLLNEDASEWGLRKNSMADFKFRFLNVAQATKFTAFEAASTVPLMKPVGDQVPLMDEDRRVLWAMGKGKGSVMTVENGLAILGKSAFDAWFPTQKGASEWMGHTKVWRENRHLISEKQEEELKGKLEPGDIFFTRHEWYMSNLGLPGFWSHAALYVGTAETRRAYFDDPAVKAWVRSRGGSGDLEDLLKKNVQYANCLKPDAKNRLPRVLEAIGEGVVFTPLEKFAEADSLSAIRPRLSKVEKARAIVRAFGYAGRPYDFNFDFQSDETLVCSELVYKAYEPVKGFKGLKFPLQTMVGRVLSSPNGMVQQFDKEYGTKDQQSDLAVFLDGHEKENKAVKAGVKVFRKSWQRPKWNVFLQ